MPKAARRRNAIHEKPVALNKRTFSVQDNAVEHVEIGQRSEASGTEILQALSQEAGSSVPLKKKEKQALKHEQFIQRLESTRTPYSKSHERRLKRKAKESVAGGLQEIKAAISALETDIPAAVQNSVPQGDDDMEKERPKANDQHGRIGESKSAPLTKTQRKRALQTERLRVPMILANSEFKTNPFQTIRTHAENTLLKRQRP